MKLLRTELTILSDEQILKYIKDYEDEEVPKFDKLWGYYRGKNSKILNRTLVGGTSQKREDSFDDDDSNKNIPDNNVPVPYGRKIVTTFTGYAYRPRYITYKPMEIKEFSNNKELSGKIEAKVPIDTASSVADSYNSSEYVKEQEKNKQSFIQLMKNYRLNNEHLKTSRAGRNTGIFGVSYELLYIDKVVSSGGLDSKAEVKFFTIDPRQMILLYDYSSEPKKVIAIRFYEVSENKYNVEVYYKDKIVTFTRLKGGNKDWELQQTGEYTNFFDDVPVVAYYFGDEMMGLIEPVIPLIDTYDVLISDSMNEFDRFAHAYLVMKNFGLTDPIRKKEPNALSLALANLKRYRVFENLGKDADVKFLTKDIPYGFIKYMTDLVQKQIHTQSHVPDFAGEKFTGASGIAIQRLLFDFENVCSDAEADFDIGLYERIRLIYNVYRKLGRADGDFSMINISHKRNSPLNLQEFATTANTMKAAGFSSYLVADIMPDDVVPDVEEELERQREEKEGMMPTVEQQNLNQQNQQKQEELDEFGNPVGTKYDENGDIIEEGVGNE